MGGNMSGQQKEDRLKDYVEVNVRIEKFYEKYPMGRILTEIISWENGVVVMKATAYRDAEDERPAATGHAYEKEGSNYINKTSALENCETSAVGRALAILGFEIKKSTASKEEVQGASEEHEEIKKTLLAGPKQKEAPETTKTIWLKLAGNIDGFDDFYKKQIDNGYTDHQIEQWLNAKVAEKQKTEVQQ